MPSTNPPIFILGEARGGQEEKIDSCFVGPSGVELLRMLHDASIISLTGRDRDCLSQYYHTNDPKYIATIWTQHPEVYRTNVFQFHPPNNDITTICGPKSSALGGYPPLAKSKYVIAKHEPEFNRLIDELTTIDPNIVICLGNTALWEITGHTAITKYRGTTLSSTHTIAGFKLIPTYHPAAILRQWENRPTLVADLIKAKKESTHADIRRPQRAIHIEPSLDDIAQFFATHCRGCEILSVDIETAGSRVTCIGFAPRADLAIVIPFDDKRSATGSYWPSGADEARAWRLITDILHDPTIPKLFQNGMYDIAFLYRAYGIRTFGAAEDTMLLHHALQPEALKGLGYLGSIYSNEAAWKHMRVKHETIKRDD